MTEPEQDLADRMHDGLQRQVRDLSQPALDLGAIRTRAGSIRRRRRAAVVAVASFVAATVAVAVPVTLSLDGDAERSQGVDPAADPTAAGASAGPLPFLQEDVVTLGDGRTVVTGLPTQSVQQFAVLGDDRVVLAVRESDSRSSIVVVDPDGGEAARYPVGAALSVRTSPDRSLVAWTDADDRPLVLESGVAEPVALARLAVPRDGNALVVGVGGSDCADGGCRVWAVTGTTSNVVADQQGVEEVRTPPGLTLSDVYAPDGEVVRMAASEQSLGGEQIPCALLLEPDGTQRARTCDAAFLRFSPDGALVQGGTYENDTTGEVTILDSDLSTVATIAPTGSVLSRIAWEDDRSLVAAELTYAGDRTSWSLVRYTVADTGSPEVLVGPVQGPDFPPLFQVPG